MSWRQKEKAIQEKRTIEATKKNLMGPAGKLGIIVQALGKPIMRDGPIGNFSILDDPLDDFTPTEYEPTASGQNGPVAWRDEILETTDGAGAPVESNPSWEGFTFEGLRWGMHFEINWLRHSHKIEASYKGYKVYTEIAGELEAYAPFPEWEDMVERLYKVAKKRHSEMKDLEQLELRPIIHQEKASFWQRLRMRWGV